MTLIFLEVLCQLKVLKVYWFGPLTKRGWGGGAIKWTTWYSPRHRATNRKYPSDFESALMPTLSTGVTIFEELKGLLIEEEEKTTHFFLSKSTQNQQLSSF